MRNIFNLCALIFCLLFFANPLFAFPNSHRVSTSLSVPPLNLLGTTAQADAMIVESDRYLWVATDDSLKRIDLQTWSLTSDQVPALTGSLSGNVTGLAIQGTSLFASQDDGDVLKIDLTNVTASPTSLTIKSQTNIGPLVADTEGGTDDDKLYILDKTNHDLLVYDVSSAQTTTIPLLDSAGQTVTPTSLVWVPFPNATLTSTTDKIYVATNDGIVFLLNEGAASATSIVLNNTDKNFPAIARTPDSAFVLVLDSSGTTVHVINTAVDTEVDTDTLTAGTDPISLTENANLTNLLITDVLIPDDVYAYVTGDDGMSAIDLNSSPFGFSVIDFTDGGSSDTTDDPLDLSKTPELLAATSDTIGDVFSSNSDGTISVISDHPFVTIESTSLTGKLSTGGTFTLTFQSDEAGTYRVRANGGLDESGTEVTSGTVSSADQDVTTAAISYNSSIFPEGTNRIFVFVEDSAGNVGHDAVDITVDAPPAEVSISDVNFGNQRVYVTFVPLTASDIDHYNIYVDTNAVTVLNKSSTSGTINQSTGGSLSIQISHLTNGVTYFVAIEGVDTSGNIGTRNGTLTSGGAVSATPEETVGPAQAVGEAGCSLVPDAHVTLGSGWVSIFTWFLLFILRSRSWRFCRGGVPPPGRGDRAPTIAGDAEVLGDPPGRPYRFPYLMLLLILSVFSGHILLAEEKSPQHFSAEFKGGVWIPTDKTMKGFLSCCQPTGSVDFGYLYHSKLGGEVEVGFSDSAGRAVGLTSGAASGDRFHLMLIPIQGHVTFRGDFHENQLFVPYVKAGPDLVFFRERSQSDSVHGLKYGFHGVVGLQFLLEWFDELSLYMERDLGINDVYLVVEGRYGWVNSFGASGFDLSGLTTTAGLLFEF